jgi:hypothetical protein
MTNKTVRIGCASAFYGDSQLAARQLVDKGNIDYLVFDYLAEVTMAILSWAKLKNDDNGYAVDFVNVAMKDVLADCAKKGIKIVANAGGVNVPKCISVLEDLCKELGISLKIAGVYGDNLAGREDEIGRDSLSEMQTGKPLPVGLMSINAYLGARPIADALDAGADVVVTGRVVDSAVMLAPLMHEFGWQEGDYDRLSQGSLVGHVLECGAQCTGGNFTDWYLVPDFSDMSYPIAEVSRDGSFVVSIPPNTGGLATVPTVAEQIVYEIADPANYLLPDVACNWSHVQLEQIGENEVKVSGAQGRAPGNQYKVCATHIDGFRLMGSFFIGGLRAADKARAGLEAWVKRTQRVFKERGWADFRQVSIEIVGAEDTYGPHRRSNDVREAMGKFGLHHDDNEALKFASSEVAYLGTSGPPGMTAFGAGRVRPQPLIRVHSALVNKDQVPVTVQIGDKVLKSSCYLTPVISEPAPQGIFTVLDPIHPQDDWVEVELEQLAYSRSGDKGDNANIGVIARKPDYLPLLSQALTAEVVAEYFAYTVKGEVSRFEIPGFNALNFFLTEALGGGGTASIQLDTQAKTMAQILLSLKVKIPPELAASL